MRQAKTHFIEEFYVRGNGGFPIDMLRYDNCWPATESDSYLIQMSRDQAGKDEWLKPRTIKLLCASNGTQIFTLARWQSFTWKASLQDEWK